MELQRWTRYEQMQEYRVKRMWFIGRGFYAATLGSTEVADKLLNREVTLYRGPDNLGKGYVNDISYEPLYTPEIDSAVNAESSEISGKPLRSSAAAQRERTGRLRMSDLAKHFHLPINAAAKELGICPTVLKKICRRNGMRRWPHRKIKSIERIIATLEQTIADGAGQGDEGIRMEIDMLRNERTQLCTGLIG